MGDLRAGTGGTTAAQPTGKRVARHSAEQVTDQPYVGRRVAVAPGRRRAEPTPDAAPTPETPSVTPTPGRRALRIDVAPSATEPEAPRATPVRAAPEAFPVESSATVESVTIEPPVQVGPVTIEPVTIAPPVQVEPVTTVSVLSRPIIETLITTTPTIETPITSTPVTRTPAVDTSAPALEPLPLTPATQPTPAQRATPRRTPSPGRRAARRRSPMPLPGAPLLIGVAVLAVSAGGALQAMRADAEATADAHHLTPASALSGTSAGGSASLLGDRDPVVSRSSDRLQANADAQAKQRAEALSGIASKAEQQSNKIELHAWVLPVAEGVYHLTARFGDYSSLWSNFHTGLDFAAPTGTPIMAVAGGQITETAYSGAYGNRTIELLPDGTELWYCHQNEFGTQVGATVRPGEVIGYVGSTGNVTGPHLHLEVHPGGGDPVDPYTALVAHGLYPGPPS